MNIYRHEYQSFHVAARGRVFWRAKFWISLVAIVQLPVRPYRNQPPLLLVEDSYIYTSVSEGPLTWKNCFCPRGSRLPPWSKLNLIYTEPLTNFPAERRWTRIRRLSRNQVACPRVGCNAMGRPWNVRAEWNVHPCELEFGGSRRDDSYATIRCVASRARARACGVRHCSVASTRSSEDCREALG